MDRAQYRQVSAAALSRDGRRCGACGSTLPFTLAVHHIIPRELGGVDELGNLRTLCANCHRLVHGLSVGRRLEGSRGRQIQQELGRRAFAVIRRLAASVRRHRHRVQVTGSRWLQRSGRSRGALLLHEAVKIIGLQNSFEAEETNRLRRAVSRVIARLPRDVRRACSFRLVRNGRFLSINAGNHLLFRTPAYEDNGTRLDADLLLIWPQATRCRFIPRAEWPGLSRHRFKAIPCFNLQLFYDEVLALEPRDWRVFARACRDALYVRRTRNWVSNVFLP